MEVGVINNDEERVGSAQRMLRSFEKPKQIKERLTGGDWRVVGSQGDKGTKQIRSKTILCRPTSRY